MAEMTGQTQSPAAALRAVGSGQLLVLLTVGLVVLAGILSGAAALWRTNNLNDSYHEALERELEEVGLAYGFTTMAFLQALGPDGALVLAELTSRAELGQYEIEGFDNDLIGFELWLPDSVSPGYGLAASRVIQADERPSDPAAIAGIVEQAGAAGAPVAVVDESNEHINIAFPIELSPEVTGVVVGTLATHSEFAFIEGQRSDAFRDAIITSIAIFGLLAIIGLLLSRAVSGHLVSRDRAEQAVRESEERYRTLASLSPVGIFRADREGNCVYANERACEIIGLSESEALGQGWAQGLHPDDTERVLSEWSHSDPLAPFRTEYRLVRPDGTIAWVLGQRAPERDEHGDITCFVGTITDITERKRMEEALREQTRRDPLTGALNHAAIVEELRNVVAGTGGGAHCAVAMADVDGMKATNDTFGHQIGDAALVTVARAMAIDGAVLGRYGGDEFVAILPGADRAAAERYRDQISAGLAEVTLTDPHTRARVPVLASIGLAVFPDEAETVVDLIKLSDIAMYSMRRQRTLPADGAIMPPRGDDEAARAIGELVPLLTAPGPLGDKLNHVAHRLCISAGYDAVNIQLYAPEPGGPSASYTVGSVGERSISAWDAYLAQDGVAVPMRQALESTKRPFIIDALTADERLTPELRWIAAAAGIRTGVVAPMVWRGQLLGSLAVGSKQTKAFGPRDAQFLAAVASQVAAVAQLSRLAGEQESVPPAAGERAA